MTIIYFVLIFGLVVVAHEFGHFLLAKANGIHVVNMNIKPLADRVLILPAAAEEKTIGGIIIPDTAKEKPLKGEVIAVGNGTKDEAMVLKKGDQVLYGKYSGTEINVDGTDYLIMKQADIMAILG